MYPKNKNVWQGFGKFLVTKKNVFGKLTHKKTCQKNKVFASFFVAKKNNFFFQDGKLL